MTGKTVKQIADELGIDRQKVYRFIKKNCIKSCITEQGANRYDDTAVNMLKMGLLEEKAVSKTVSPNSCEQYHEQGANRYDDTVVEVLKKQLGVMQKNLDVLHEELKEKNEHIKELTAVIDKQADSVHVDRQKLLAETIVDGQQKLSMKEVPSPETTPIKKAVKESSKKPKKRSIFNIISSR